MKMRVMAIGLCLALLFTVGTVGTWSASADAPLTFTASYATTDGATLSSLTAYDAATNAALASGIADGVTLESSTGIPCQVFEVDVSGTTAAAVTLTANVATIENERVALKAYNPSTDTWDMLATAVTGSDALSASVELASYAKDGKVQAMVTPDYVANGTNRLLWSTDQQHYTKFEDLNQTYYDLHTYVAKEYENGNMAYLINTGDIVDDNPKSAAAKGQWIVADKAFDILDEANVPYGIATGNHDVGDYPTNNYTPYSQYFSEERYADRPWYGGTADNNGCHYDLVTVGNKDLLFLYFGYGLEAMDPEWAKSVIEMYPHRSVILCTHQYLSPTELTLKGRAQIMFDTLVEPYENVVMVLSGHYSGAGYVTKDIDGRIVQEVVADYQFVQKESIEYYEEKGVKDPQHKIGGVVDCNGEGYIREIIIEGNTVDMYAFSPVTGGETPFGQRDDLTLAVSFVPTERRVTTYAFAATEGDTPADLSNPSASADGVAVLTAADRDNLKTMIQAASDLKKKDFTADSFTAMKDALKAAKAALKASDEDVRAAAAELSNAMGALCEKEDEIPREKLTEIHAFDMNLESWENADGTKSLFTDYSFIEATQLEEGGFSATASKKSPNTWPAVKYKEILNFTPEDGKVYLYLDVEAGSTWSVYPTVIQDGKQYMGRWNYIIEGSYDDTFDAGSGTYKGVYDVTQALIDLGVDPTEEMTLTFSANVVPGPVTFREIAILTGDYSAGFTMDINTVAILVGGVILVALAVVLIVVLRKPKETAKEGEKPEEDEKAEE